MTEKLIIQACQRKDPLGQRAFVDTYSRYLLGVCFRYAGNADFAKDCLQESLIHILNNIGKYKDQGRFKSWISMVTANKCLEIIRREKKHRFADMDVMNEPSMAETSSYKLEMEDVMAFIQTLPDNYRIAVNMYIVEGYNHKEIAEQLGITESSSRSLVSRARNMIKTNFEKENLKLVHKKRMRNEAGISRLK